MNKLKEISYYLKYISFIFFLYSAIIIYPGLITQKIGICLLILIIIYSVVTFFMFLAQKKGEQYNTLNNLVLFFVHLYFCFITYKYQTISTSLVDTNNYFALNYFVTSLCLFTLTINKFILSTSKEH